MAKKKTASQGLAMPDLQWLETPEGDSGKPSGSDAGSSTAQQLAALQEQIGKLNADLETQRATNLALLSQPLVQTPQAAPQVDMRNLPDPTLDPEAYAAEVAKRTTAYIGSVQQHGAGQAAQAAQLNGRVEALWDDFGKDFPAYAANPERVEYAATKVAERAAKRGLDVNKYVFGASKQFMADVAKEMDAVFGKPQEVDEDTSDDTDDQRTAGLFGGNESGGRAAAPEGKPEGFQPHSMFRDVQDWQAKTGFTR